MQDFNCRHPIRDPKGTSYPCGKEVFDWVISDLFPLNHPDIPTLLHQFLGSRFSFDISFAPGRCFRTCVFIASQFYYSSLFLPKTILLSVSRKLLEMTLLFTLTLAVLLQSAEEYSSLSSGAALFSDTECGKIFHFFWLCQMPT